jgi:hypothetical protein
VGEGALCIDFETRDPPTPPVVFAFVASSARSANQHSMSLSLNIPHQGPTSVRDSGSGAIAATVGFRGRHTSLLVRESDEPKIKPVLAAPFKFAASYAKRAPSGRGPAVQDILPTVPPFPVYP